jgi:hypothetical protein
MFCRASVFSRKSVGSASRVTRLGEFSPIGSLFSLGSYFENCPICTTFFHGEKNEFCLTKYELAYFLGFFSPDLLSILLTAVWE